MKISLAKERRTKMQYTRKGGRAALVAVALGTFLGGGDAESSS